MTSTTSRFFYTALLLISFGGLGVFVQVLSPPRPDLSVLRGAHLPALQSGKFNQEWQRFFRKVRLFAKRPLQAELTQALGAISRGKWLAGSTALSRELRRLRPRMFQLQAAWPKSGCYLKRVTWEKGHGKRPLRAIGRVLSLWGLLAVWELQSAQPQLGSERLARMRNKLQSLISKCPIPRPDLIFWMASLRRIHQLHDYVRAVPALDSRRAQHERAIVAWWSRQPTYLRTTLQWDHRALYDELKRRHQVYKSGWLWFWRDLSETRALLDHWLRAMVRISVLLELDASQWAQTPIEKVLQQSRERSKFIAAFQKNAIGMELLAQALPPGRMRSLFLGWHQHRCVIAAHAVRWPYRWKFIKDKPYTLIDHFAQKKFIRHAFTVCAIPKRFGFGLSTKQMAAVPFPAIPQRRQPTP